MINQYYSTDEFLKMGFKIILDSHNINHANSLLTVDPNFPQFGIKFRHINKVIKEMAINYARLMNQYKFKYHIFISAGFYMINEENQESEEIEIFINLNTNLKMTETDIDNIDVKSQLEHQIQIQETKDSRWLFEKINSMKI